MEQYIGLLISPVLFLFLFIFLKYRYPKGEFKLLFRSFLYGLLLIVPVVLADQAAHYLHIDGARSIRRMFVYSFVVVGFVVEFSKFLPLWFDISRRKIFGGAADGIVYASAISLGLTTLYAAYYFFMVPQDGFAWLYFLTLGPMNLIFAVILGFFVGMGKIRGNRFIDWMTGIGAASFFHGIYRFTMLSSDLIFFVLFAGGALFIALILIRRSKYIKPENR